MVRISRNIASSLILDPVLLCDYEGSCLDFPAAILKTGQERQRR
jgi:hypothetical protein